MKLIAATRIVQRLQEAGYIAYFAGGWVRDYLMKHPSDDIDIATNAPIETIQSMFAKTVPVGIAFGILIVVEEGFPYEVATFRKERGYMDGRRPTSIESASPEEDAVRRDFTINGMFYDPTTTEIYDYVGGRKDLKRGIIRAIGDADERFLEDRLRMMRAVRYSTRFNFPIEEKTLAAIKKHASTLLPAVAMERIWQEFKKMSQFAHFDRSLVILHEISLLQTIFPALKDISTQEIAKRVCFIEKFPKGVPTIVELLELFLDHSLDAMLALCEYLKLSNPEKDFVRFYHHAHNLLSMPLDWLEKLELAEWAHFYAHPDCSVCLEIFSVRLSEEKQKDFRKEHAERQRSLQAAIERIRQKKPLLAASRLLEAGIPAGKNMGLLLKEAEKISINQGLDNPEKVMEILQNHPLWPN